MTRYFRFLAAASLAGALSFGVTTAQAQTENAAAPAAAVSASTAQVTVTSAPPETREVVATGRAAVGVGGIPAARKAAQAQALRNAVEKTLGVYVNARTRTQNYVLVRDEVTTHASGYATLQSVERETISLDGSEVTSTVRALVSLRPLAEQLKASRLTRAWRVYVPVKGGDNARPARAQMEAALEQAGFVVVSSPKDADVLVDLAPSWQATSNTPLDTAAGPMTMHGVRANVTVRATRTGTGEVVAALSAPAQSLHVSGETARAQSAETAARALSPHLVDALLLLPARDFVSVALVVQNINSAARMGKLEDVLQTASGVQNVVRRSYQNGAGAWELDVATDAVPLLTRTLEEDAAFKPFGLRVSEESRAKIVASASASVAPVKARRVSRNK